jgi:hypothetical protein
VSRSPASREIMKAPESSPQVSLVALGAELRAATISALTPVSCSL